MIHSNMTIIPHLFPSPILINDLEVDHLSDSLNDLAYKLEKEDSDFKPSEYPNGYTSFFTQSNLQSLPETRPLCLHIVEKTKELFHHCGYRTDQIPIAITALWCSIQRKGAQHGLHNHRMAMFSGTYYSKATDDAANLMFQTPLETHKMHMPHPVPQSENFTDDHYVNAKSGRVVVFPSYLNHRVMTHQTDEDRISWSFNINYYNFFR